MSRSFKIQEYQITVGFKSETFMSINAEHLATQEMFSNEAVELMHIKRDTVLATLQRKSEKNLSCECEQYLKDGIKYLGVVFVVNFDYLPEFREELELQLVDRKEQGSKLQMNNCLTEIEYISSVVDSFEKESKLSAELVASVQTAVANFGWKKTLPKGTYLLRMSGGAYNTTGVTGFTILKFQISFTSSKHEICVSYPLYMNSTQLTLFSFSEILNCKQEEDVEVKCAHEGGNINLGFGQPQMWLKDVVMMTSSIMIS